MSMTLKDLAQRLERDIRGRGLMPGHRYLTGEESAHLLGTSVATANRALQMLAEQDIVIRRKSSGTFVGPALAREEISAIRTIVILAPASEKVYASLDFGALIEGLLANVADVADVRISLVPAERPIEFVKAILEPVHLAGQLAGVVAISGSYDVYQYLGECKYPFVVMGSLYPGQSYPAIETDERQAGLLLATYLIERGHRRIAMFSNSETRPGDHHFHDGVSEALTSASLPHSALLFRAPGANPAVLEGQVTELLEMTDPPTAFLARLPRWADDIAAIAGRRKPQAQNELEIVFVAMIGRQQGSRFTHVRSSMSTRDVAELVGRTLAQTRQRAPVDELVTTIPFEICYGDAIDRNQ